jgi:hypothetical protein
MDGQFLRFVELFGVTLNSTNFKIYNDLYRHFNEFRTPNEGEDSFEKKFILWKNQSDMLLALNNPVEQNPVEQTNLIKDQTPPPNTPTQMVENTNHMPYKLQQLADVTVDAFHNFTLQKTPVVLSHTVNTATTYGEVKSEKPERHGKNIDVLKAAYAETLETSTDETLETSVDQPKRPTSPETFTTNAKKRKRPVRKAQGSGRPTYDDSMVRIANDSSDDAAMIPLNSKQLLLLTSTGEIRKKTTIYTRHENDIKCFAIKHYASFIYVAERRKKALEKIKKQRTKLEQLNYIETNLLPLVRDNDNF